MIYESAGIAGVDPGPMTLRELLWMSEARGRHEWGQTAFILAKLHNVNCTKESDCITPDDCNPYVLAERGKKPAESQTIMVPITALKDVFVR